MAEEGCEPKNGEGNLTMVNRAVENITHMMNSELIV